MKILRRNIYLDIDGVILTKGAAPAMYLEEFLEYILNHYSVFWLTSRCHGDVKYTLRYLSRFLSADIINLLRKIKPTSFRIDKTEAIDFNSKFFWIDDEVFASEKNTLIKYDKLNSLIEVNLKENPDRLLQLIYNELFIKKPRGGELND